MSDRSDAIARRLEGLGARGLTRDEIGRWRQRWRQRYARGLHAETGEWCRDGFDWHVFSWGHAPAISGADAKRSYENVEPTDFIAVNAWDGDEFGFAGRGQPPDLDLGLDVLVFPRTLAWTIAFTHEAHCGPYFSTLEQLKGG